MKKISSQKDIDDLLAFPIWEDAFIREWYLLSPTYVCEDQSIVAPYALPSMKMIVCSSDSTFPGLELFFEDLKGLSCFFDLELDPEASYSECIIWFYINGMKFPPLEAKNLYYKVLSEDSWGWKTSCGRENFFDQGGFIYHEKLENNL